MTTTTQLINNSKLHILQWNARSLFANKASLQNFLISNPVDIIVLSEIWLKPSSNFHLKGYNFVKKCRDDGKGGVGILLADGLFYREFKIKNNFNKDIEVCAVDNINGYISIVSVYKPPNILATNADWENLFSQFNGNTIFCGDFNSHHGVWGSKNENSQGKCLMEAIDSLDLITLNDGSPTRFSSPGHNCSVVDLTISSPQVAEKIYWEVQSDTLGSDHFPILIKLQINHSGFQINPSTKWNDSRANWNIFQLNLNSQIYNQPDLKKFTNSEKYAFLFDAISNAARESMPFKKPFKPKVTRPCWWDDDCLRMIQLRKETLKKYKCQSNLDNYLAYKCIAAKTRRLLRQKQKNCWISFLNKLNKSTPASDIWRIIKSINNKSYQYKKPVIPSSIIDQLLDILAPPSCPNLTPDYNNTEALTIYSACKNSLEKPFTMIELDLALKNSRSTAPGLDGFTYKILCKLPTSAKMLMLEIFNNWWLKHEFLQDLKEIIICLILKPLKNPDLPSSYRPISLMSCVTKTFERMIKLRLEHFIEYNALLPKSQYGFRRGQGTIDAVSQLVTDIQITFSGNGYLICLFLDLKGAYDVVDLDLLHKKMKKRGISPKVSTSIIELFKNRKIFIRDNSNVLHGPRFIYNGIPQGSILSPLLFNIYTAELHDMFDDNIGIVQYADDICLYATHDSYERCMTDLEYIIRCTKAWMFESGFSMAPEKSAIMCFTRHRLSMEDSLTICDYNIPVVAEYKYLGIILDRKLLWSKHINYIKSKSERGINMLKCIAKSKYGADPKISLMFYRSYIRSIIDYGCVFYGSASNSNLTKIDRIQYKAIRICIGAMKSSPCQAILVEAQEPPLYLRRQYLANKTVIKYRTFNTLLLKKTNALSIENLVNHYWSKKNSPPLADAFTDTYYHEEYILRKDQFPLFQCNYETVITKPNITFPLYSDSHIVNNSILRAILNELGNVTSIFTDGSKSEKGTGSAFYVSDTKYVEKYRIPNFSSIFTAEAVAIEKALVWCTKNHTQRAVIISDSKPVLQSISGHPYRHYKNNIMCNIKKLLCYLSHNKQDIKFIWVKGHAGISGNEFVDVAAKEACNITDITKPDLYADIINTYKSDMWQKWKQRWESIADNEKNHYYLIHPSLPNSISHISVFKVSREYSTIITRLKLNHGYFPAHLYRIGVVNSPICACDNTSAADLNHIFFACNNHKDLTSQFLSDILKLKLELPMNITVLLATSNKEIFDIVVNFIKKANVAI